MTGRTDIHAWGQADALFDQWLDLGADERDAWLDGLDVDADVRARLHRLIDAHLGPGTMFGAPAAELAGMRLGGWTLDAELGRGGMAVVYRAWRGDGIARQHAALKVLTVGALGATGRERFHREAEILARLNHPNITPLVDSGTSADGTCWLAMPLVEGVRIDTWCDTRGLDTRGVAKLVLQVCEAVAYAHRNLVIHRDIKPSNVLVEAGGHARLLDFGIGQFADSADDPTRTMWRALTPGYAAPEQLRGEPPSTAIDVFGLGALLHRLLTGTSPTAAAGHATRPSLLVRDAGNPWHRHHAALRSDLDRVLLKALAEEPGQRFATAEAMGDDLRRWLDGRPVLAEQPKLAYRMRKFVARNRVGVAAGVLLLGSLAGGAGATLWQWSEARRHATVAERNAAIAEAEAANAREQAENAAQRAHRAEAVRDFVGGMMITVRGPDDQPARVTDVIDAAAQGARGNYGLAKQPEPLVASDVLLLTGVVRFNLGDHERSLADFETALELLTPHADVAPGELSRLHWELMRHAKRQGRPDQMLVHARRAMELNESWDAPPRERTRTRIAFGEALLYSDREEAARIFRQLLAEIEGSELKDSVLHINALNGLSIALSGPEHDPRLRLPIQEERLRIAKLIYHDEGGGLAHTLGDVTHTYRDLGMLERAEELARAAVEVADRTMQDPERLQATARCSLGRVLLQQGRFAEAVEVFSRSVELSQRAGDRQLSTEQCSTGLAYAAAAEGRPAKAFEALDRSLRILEVNGRGSDPSALEVCGLRASVALRFGTAEPGSILERCAPEDPATAPPAWRQARAEWLLSNGHAGQAAPILAGLREDLPPRERHRAWMRPWMLSILLAHRQGDDDLAADLEGHLSGHAATEPLAGCLAGPTEATCLALP